MFLLSCAAHLEGLRCSFYRGENGGIEKEEKQRGHGDSC